MADPQSTVAAEQWKPVAGYEGLYEVSDLGRVRRLPRFQVLNDRWGKPFHRLLSGMMLNPTLTDRYLCVNLRKEGKGHTTRLNILVCSHFNGAKPTADACALHNNGDRFDNRAVNLRWGSHLENAADREAHGRTAKGERQHSARLTASDVQDIRRQVAAGTTMADASRLYGVHKGTVRNIVLRTTWAHVE